MNRFCYTKNKVTAWHGESSLFACSVCETFRHSGFFRNQASTEFQLLYRDKLGVGDK
jgi:hypothetical protein